MKKPSFVASLIERTRLTKPPSLKETWHLVLHSKEHPLSYEVGDSLAIYPENCPYQVEQFMQAVSCCHGHESFLLREVDLAKVPLGLAKAVSGCVPSAKKAELEAFCSKEVVRGSLHIPVSTFLRYFEVPVLSFDQLSLRLAPLLPRYYSIASSLCVCPQQAELTVSKVQHEVLGVIREGVCSTFLTDRAKLYEQEIKMFVHHAAHFRLPKEAHAPLIMIGTGTGVAPFRAFLQELEHTRCVFPSCWLFFGSRSRAHDFLYEDFFIKQQKKPSFIFTPAFSRDFEEKAYVQHKMWEERAQLASWIDAQGAYIYVCGDAKRMARDVEATLVEILIDQNVVASKENAVEYLSAMRKSKRYCKDVY